MLKYAVPALMLTVIAVQHYRAATFDQTPWKGGGFGMFASNDHRPTRVLRITVVDEEGVRRTVVLSAKRQYLVEKFLAAPTKEALIKVKHRFRDLQWMVYPHNQVSDRQGAFPYGAKKLVPKTFYFAAYKINYNRPDRLAARLILEDELVL